MKKIKLYLIAVLITLNGAYLFSAELVKCKDLFQVLEEHGDYLNEQDFTYALTDELLSVYQLLGNYEAALKEVDSKTAEKDFIEHAQRNFRKTLLRFYFLDSEELSVERVQLLGAVIANELKFLHFLGKESLKEASGEILLHKDLNDLLTFKPKNTTYLLQERLKSFVERAPNNQHRRDPNFQRWVRSLKTFVDFP